MDEAKEESKEEESVSLSQCDFERMQNTLVELKTQNYSLAEQARKSQTAASEALSRVSRLEQEVSRAQRVIAKSKRALEVQQMAQDAEMMQKRMEEQQEQFRMQNQTLLDELAKLVAVNEGLEARLKGGDKEDISEEEDILDKEDNDENIEVDKGSQDNEGKSVNSLDAAAVPEKAASTESDAKVTFDRVGQQVSFAAKTIPRRASLASGTEELSLMSDLRRSVSSLQQERSSLLSQLQGGYEAFEAFKAKTREEQRENELKMENMKEEFEKRLKTMSDENAIIKEELQKKVDEVTKENERITNELSATTKSNESRKRLLDEMAVTIQKNVEEHQSKVSALEEEVEEKNNELRTNSSTISDLRADLSRYHRLNEDLTQTNNDLSEETHALKNELSSIKAEKIASEAEKDEAHEKALRKLRDELSEQCKELQLQLEIANAERVEFDEKCKRLENEIEDGIEERKIAERKHALLLKDLKKQLAMEKNRGERLQERLKEASTAINDNVCISASPSPENDPERTSISSWSLMSSPTAVNDTPIKGDSTPTKSNNGDHMASSENKLLLAKIASLQEERLVLEERLSLLQTSSAAMADDLVQKSNLIHFYCMNNAATPRSASLPQGVKRVVDRLVPQENVKEMQRLQTMLEETLTKNMHLQQDLRNMADQLQHVKNNKT